MSGTVHLVGAGPGAPDLLTLRAARLIERADVVFYDALVHPEIVALAAHAEKIAVGKRCGRHAVAQRFINLQLVNAARRHACVVRLKGGDPLIFGRAQEELDALGAAGIPVEIVPGVTAVSAAAADLGVSLTLRGISRSLTIVTPRVGAGESTNDWSRALAGGGTIAIYMGAGEAAALRGELLAAGIPPTTPAAVVENASLGSSKFVGTVDALPALAAQRGDGPALILIGEVLAGSVAQPRAALALDGVAA